MEENKKSGLTLNKKTIVLITSLLVAIMVFVGVLTQVLPRGEYEVIQVDGHESIVDGTYHTIDYKLPIWKIVLSPIMCFTSSQAATGLLIIAMIVFIGGSFLILDKCGILEYIMSSLINRFEKKKYLLLAVVTFVLMLLSSTSGVLEESVTLVPLAVAISLGLGWDSFVGIAMSLIAIAWGFTAATFNPFNVVTVQKLAGLPIFSGLWLRIIVFVVVYLVFFAFIYIYAKKVEKNPQKSLAYESDKLLKEKFTVSDINAVLNDQNKKKGTKAFLICMLIDAVCIVIDFAFSLGGVVSLPAIAILFTVGSLTAGSITGLKGKKLIKSFFDGTKTILPAIPLIIAIVAISYVLNEGKIMHTILYNINNLMQGLSPYAAILLLFAVIAIMEFFVGSGTAKAFLIMPIVAPLSDLVGITRQSVVTTFCLADGFTNLLYPTSGIMIIAIGIVGISYGKWLKWSWKLFAAEFAVSIGFMLLMVAINY